MRNEEGDAQRKKTKYGHDLLKSSNVKKTARKYKVVKNKYYMSEKHDGMHNVSPL